MRESRYAEEYLPQILDNPEIERLPRKAIMTPDLLVTCGGERFLIEEKERIDDKNFTARRREVLLRGEIHNFTVPRIADNILDGILSHAVKQMASEGAPPHDYSLVWFTATGVKAEAVFDQCIATIYGTTEILGLHLTNLVTCYFFRNSSFFRHSQYLDGVIVAHVSPDEFSCKLCINPLSPRYDSFRETAFVAAFQRHNAVEDPIVHEKEGIAFTLDSDLDRRDESALLAYLENKYSVQQIQAMPMSYVSGELLFPETDAEGED
jgi:hypothetical protein